MGSRPPDTDLRRSAPEASATGPRSYALEFLFWLYDRVQLRGGTLRKRVKRGW